MPFVIYTKVSIHKTEKVAEMTSHDFRLQNGKEDRLKPIEELKGTNPTTIVEGPVGRENAVSVAPQRGFVGF